MCDSTEKSLAPHVSTLEEVSLRPAHSEVTTEDDRRTWCKEAARNSCESHRSSEQHEVVLGEVGAAALALSIVLDARVERLEQRRHAQRRTVEELQRPRQVHPEGHAVRRRGNRERAGTLVVRAAVGDL